MPDDDKPIAVIDRRDKPRIARPNIDVDNVDVMLKDRPYALQMIMLDTFFAMADFLEDTRAEIMELRRMFSDMVPEGRFIPLDYIVSSDKPVVIDKQEERTLPWNAFRLYNDGPDPLAVSVNKDVVTKSGALAPGEFIDVDMKAPKVDMLVLECTDTSTDVRIYAIK